MKGSSAIGGMPESRAESSGVARPAAAPQAGPSSRPQISTCRCMGEKTEPAARPPIR
ncbi:hypothetical protein RWV98_02205 [Agathobaculum sp. NTUH-O15-33]|nr:hypothetical protein [Agathobaculum sp. NTUH-O15-33]WNX85111.1 hypothetical protein RWV98_02205 [Agathobaculum sp. NTUH-O15-33]